MFTGIIRYLGIIKKITNYDTYSELIIFSAIEDIVKIGDSICINGICLTVVNTNKDNYEFTFNIINETKLKTTFNSWKEQDEVNIELSLKNDRFDGHIVSGHVDCIGELTDIKDNIFFFKAPTELISLITDKGSISIDGVSLTISTCFNNIFTVSIIPHTLQWTIFKNYKVNNKVNLEGDYRLKQSDIYYGDITNMIGKYILSDEHAMSIALKISEKGLYTAPPNPHVGCIITKDKKIIGMGYHTSPGNPHAEVEAFENAKLNGITSFEDCELYVTLEPCCHIGRTGRCTDKILTNKIKRVVIGVCDTDDRVLDKSKKILEEAAIEVTILNDESVIKSLTPYLYQRKYKCPYVYLKIASSIDGQCSDNCGNSKWITCEESRKDAHLNLRARVQCIITTSSTVLKDYPKLNIRVEGNYKQPLIALLDRNNKVKIEDIKKCGWNNYVVWKDDYISLLFHLYKEYNVISVLFECGGTLMRELIKENIPNNIYMYMSPDLIGCHSYGYVINETGLLKDKVNLGKIIDVKQINTDVRLIIQSKGIFEKKMDILKNKIKASIKLIKKFSSLPLKSCISYNGGKDSNVILHLLKMNDIDIPAFRFCKDLEFVQVNLFAEKQYFKMFNKGIIDFNGEFKEGLEECINKHKVDVIFMGCRESDFKNNKHCNIEITDDGWPQIIRVYPIFDWTYEEVWLYHKMYNLDYCSLYDEGYTSLGVYYKTYKNKELQNIDGTYKKAKDVNSVINERSYRE